MNFDNGWVLEGQRVRAEYHGSFPVEGTVTESRVTYGGAVKHTVVLAEPVMIYGALRDTLLFYHEDVEVLNG
jgi:hypothetical protein